MVGAEIATALSVGIAGDAMDSDALVAAAAAADADDVDLIFATCSATSVVLAGGASFAAAAAGVDVEFEVEAGPGGTFDLPGAQSLVPSAETAHGSLVGDAPAEPSAGVVGRVAAAVAVAVAVARHWQMS